MNSATTLRLPGEYRDIRNRLPKSTSPRTASALPFLMRLDERDRLAREHTVTAVSLPCSPAGLVEHIVITYTATEIEGIVDELTARLFEDAA